MKAKNILLMVVALLAYWLGLCNASAFYDPGAQRWVNRDPLGEMADKNLYRMVGNQTPDGVDIFGLLTLRWPPPPPEGNCDEQDIADCKAKCLANNGMYLKKCTAKYWKQIISYWSNGIQTIWTEQWYKSVTCECGDPRSCPPPDPGTGHQNDPPRLPPQWPWLPPIRY